METFSSKKYRLKYAWMLWILKFKMYNPDLDILTMVTKFISTLYYAKYKKKTVVCFKY